MELLAVLFTEENRIKNFIKNKKRRKKANGLKCTKTKMLNNKLCTMIFLKDGNLQMQSVRVGYNLCMRFLSVG